MNQQPIHASSIFYPEPLPLPQTLKTTRLHLEPLTPAHVKLDYAAVMASKSMLRLWSGTTWPSDAFTLQENRADLVWHAREHAQRAAFTYTALNPGGDFCLGCVYIKPLTAIIAKNPNLAGEPSPTALVRFWISQPYQVENLDRHLLQALIHWLQFEWAFQQFYFHARAVHTQQLQLFKSAGLQCRYRVQIPDRGGVHFLFS